MITLTFKISFCIFYFFFFFSDPAALMALLVLCKTRGATLHPTETEEELKRTQTGLWQEEAQEEALQLLPP